MIISRRRSYSDLVQVLMEVGRELSSGQAMRLRTTLQLKGKRKGLVARSSPSGVTLRPKMGKDILKMKLRTIRRKHNPMYQKQKQKRAFKLTDKGIRA